MSPLSFGKIMIALVQKVLDILIKLLIYEPICVIICVASDLQYYMRKAAEI